MRSSPPPKRARRSSIAPLLPACRPSTRPFPRRRPAERAEWLSRPSQAIQERAQELARPISSLNSCPIQYSFPWPSRTAAMVLDAYDDIAENFPFEELRTGSRGGKTLVRRAPAASNAWLGGANSGRKGWRPTRSPRRSPARPPKPQGRDAHYPRGPAPGRRRAATNSVPPNGKDTPDRMSHRSQPSAAARAARGTAPILNSANGS